MHARLHLLDSPDLAPDTLDSYQPPVPDSFGILCRAEIGPDDSDGHEAFYVTVCSPRWLAWATMTENAKGFEFVRHRLAVDRWDPSLFRRAISDLCIHTSGESWPDVAVKLSRYLHWEFEDYSA